MKSLYQRAAACSLLILCMLLSAVPNLLPSSMSAKLPDWYTENTLSLGLDLQGGSHLLLQADQQALLLQAQQGVAGEVGDALQLANIAFRWQGAADTLSLIFNQESALQQARQALQPLSRDAASSVRRFDMSQQGLQLNLKITEDWQSHLLSEAVERSLEVVRRRLDETGLVEPSITRQGRDYILVQMPGVADPSEIRTLLGTTAKMTFHWVAEVASEPTQTQIYADASGEQRYRVESDIALEGQHIRDARLAFHPQTGAAVVNFSLDTEGARRFAEMTRENIGRALAIVLDGQVITAPVIRGVISGGSGEISGSFTPREAGDLALLLRAGALPVPLQVIEERTVGPDLGSDAIAMGVTTGVIGAVLVLAFMLAIYGSWGAIACVALLVNLGLMLGVLSLLRATLTLPGIAGIILTLGMAVDANILINERIREEARKGYSAAMALKEGFSRAWSTILDSNLTTLIAVSLLFFFGSGPVKGFAVTIGIGLLTSLFTSITLTRVLMEWRIRHKTRQPLTIAGLPWLDRLSQRVPNLMRVRHWGLALSLTLSLLSVALFFQPGMHYGVDFTGGTLVEVHTHDMAPDALRAQLSEQGLTQLSIQSSGDSGQYLVRLPLEAQQQAVANDQVEQLKQAVLSVQPDAEFPRTELVGPRVSGDFSDMTILAILIAGGGMLGYLWWCFESHFALAATLTIALDLTKTLGFFVLTGIEFNLTAVAALLALIGYSMNDKVVVFDRIRENLRLTPHKPMHQLLNESIGSTLTRTVFTSVTTLLALLPMAVYGGSAVSSFALPMLFGVVVGTASSIFIASPLLYMLSQRRERQGLGQLRPTVEDQRRELELMP
ncbi:Protein-export membrane protein SecD [Nitrincola lacisaponensis]|uniref:Multifunctional fusion protein n=1 Tax=Nitrincola lacisaponensis TaxID=267850 RepID=A0A063Y691_9GAMM|nr:protein translocase subunit SecD [Nitrincola lacisaponensis]KDE41214.1 Protein-export membrane protein SecD [Nitrincola lacisaponensis]